MDSQKEEAAMSEKIVKGGPSRTEAQRFNAPKKAVHRLKLGIADRIALGLSGLGIVALAGTVIDAQNQTPPPQVTPDQRGSVPPPEGVTFPEGVQADAPVPAPVPDAPVEQLLSHKVFLPNVANQYREAPPSPAELFLRSTKVIDAVSTIYNGRTYTAETRVTPAATYKVTIKEELKERVARLVAQDGEKYQFTGAKIIIASSTDEIPEGISMGTSFTVANVGTPQVIEFRAGRFGGARMGNEVTVFFVPDAGLHSLLSDPAVQDAVQRTIAQHFMRLIYSGGRGDYAAVSLAGQTDYINLINQRSFLLLRS